jgi:hypothetical protein
MYLFYRCTLISPPVSDKCRKLYQYLLCYVEAHTEDINNFHLYMVLNLTEDYSV